MPVERASGEESNTSNALDIFGKGGQGPCMWLCSDGNFLGSPVGTPALLLNSGLPSWLAAKLQKVERKWTTTAHCLSSILSSRGQAFLKKTPLCLSFYSFTAPALMRQVSCPLLFLLHSWACVLSELFQAQVFFITLLTSGCSNFIVWLFYFHPRRWCIFFIIKMLYLFNS